jgi:hypothetical protein
VGEEAVEFKYDKEIFLLKQPAMTDGAGKPFRLGGDDAFGPLARVPVEVTLAPRTEIELSEWKAELRATGEKDNEKPHFSTLYRTGKVLLQYEQLADAVTDPILSRLATGKLELEIKSDPPPTRPEKKLDFDKDSDPDKTHAPRVAHRIDKKPNSRTSALGGRKDKADETGFPYTRTARAWLASFGIRGAGSEDD